MSIIKIENLSKKYIIGHDKAASGMYRYSSLRDSIAHTCRGIGQRLRHPLSPNSETTSLEEFWALKDINLEIEQGDKVGIIGRNGAGKSTLLKILSRITEPTTGKFTIKGRIASLLEVGTGFHPELSGRENIYLNGAILGMSRREIKKKFDEIVDFSGVEKFLDTPVKRYSSGMYVRLAFAVAAHLEPEILLIDEVLAVGDAEFQKKCLCKMDDVSKQGRTILFVSHNMAAIQQLCSKGIVLNEGSMTFCGAIADAISSYISGVKTVSTIDIKKRTDRKGSQWLKFTSVGIYNSEGKELRKAMSGQDIFVRMYYKSVREKQNVSVLASFNIKNSQGYLLTNLNSVDSGQGILNIYENGYFECCWPKFNLKSGNYDCNLFCSVDGEVVDWMQNAFVINVEDGNYFQTGKMIGREQGEILIYHTWSCQKVY